MLWAVLRCFLLSRDFPSVLASPMSSICHPSGRTQACSPTLQPCCPKTPFPLPGRAQGHPCRLHHNSLASASGLCSSVAKQVFCHANKSPKTSNLTLI